MSQYYTGIDIGTTATKAVVFDAVGQVVFQHSVEYPMFHPHPQWSIQEPQDILAAVLLCIEVVREQYVTEFISFSSAMQSILVVDQNHNLLTDCILWADNRASDVADELKNSALGKDFYQKTGIPIHTFSPMTKILWLKKHEPAIFEKAAKFISIKEYIWYYLTGEYCIDTSMASGTGIFNIHDLVWEESILSFLEIEASQLSPIVSSYHTAYAKNSGQLLVLGGGDGVLANLGTGAMNKGKIALTIGTSGAVRLSSKGAFVDELMRTQCYHFSEDQYLKLGAVNNGAIVLQWLKEAILKTEMSFVEMFQQAESVLAGSEGLVFVPYLLGERAPIWDANAKGLIMGLTINHQQAHLIRATMEGIVFGLLHITEVLLPAQERDQISIMVSGGFAKSALWLQIVADVFQMNVEVSGTVEGSAWGAVMIGFGAIGKPIPVLQQTEQVICPNPDTKAVYQANFQQFKKVYPFINA
jgi:gluconokinase